MTEDEYREMYAQALSLDEDFAPIDIPIDQLPGEEIADTLLRFLEEEGMIVMNDDVFVIPDRQKIADFDPNLLKILDAIWLSETYATLDSLEEMGLVYTSVDEDGNIIHSLTEAGLAALDAD
jgi:hypothetical protein